MKKIFFIRILNPLVFAVLSTEGAVFANEFHDSFEGATLSEQIWQIDADSKCEISVDMDPEEYGNRSVNFVAESHSRCELIPLTITGPLGTLRRKLFREPFDTDRWYSFRTKLVEPWEKDFRSEVLAQWHSSPDPFFSEGGRGPSLAIRVYEDIFRITYGWDANFRTSDLRKSHRGELWRGRIITGRWVKWVMRVRWSHTERGIVEVWLDGTKIVSYKGPNTFNDLRGVYLKLGIYHPGQRRVVQFDDVVISGKEPK